MVMQRDALGHGGQTMLRQRTGLRWLVSAGVLGCFMSASGQTNLIKNPGLEIADPANAERPIGFEPGRVGKNRPAVMAWESPGYRSSRCITVETQHSSDLGYWQTLVPVEPESTYTIRFHYKTRATPSTDVVGADPLYNQGRAGGPNLELGLVPDDSADVREATAWSDIGLALPPVGGLFLPVAADWAPFHHSFTTRPGQKRLLIKLRVWCYAQKAWFDDLNLVAGVVSPPRPARDPAWTVRDTTPPSVFRPRPPPNTQAQAAAVIRASFAESGSGIDPGSVSIMTDDTDLTGRAKITASGVTLAPVGPLAPGPHRARISVSDKAGNRSNTLSWQFGVGKPLRNLLQADSDPARLNGEPFFALGIYAYACHPDDGRFREDHLEQAADAGYNIVLNTIERQQGLDKELNHGIMGTLNVTYGLKECSGPAEAREALLNRGQGRFVDHPCVVALWADDPENIENTEATPVPPSTLEKLGHARRVLAERAPGLPWIFAISNLPRLAPAMPYGDILLSYRYATPQYHPMMINGWTIAICRTTVPDKPMWFLSQAIDLGYGAKVGLPEPFRPTPAEVQAMAFYSLVCGVKGYCLYANYINAEDYPDHWTMALSIATRLRVLAPALAAGTSGSTARLQRDTHSGSVLIRELAHRGRTTLIAVNMSAGTVPATWQFAEPVKVAALFEDRAMAQVAQSVHDVFEPWSVHIYQWTDGDTPGQ